MIVTPTALFSIFEKTSFKFLLGLLNFHCHIPTRYYPLRDSYNLYIANFTKCKHQNMSLKQMNMWSGFKMSKTVYYYIRQITHLFHDPCLEVLAVHGNELHIAKSYQCIQTDQNFGKFHEIFI